MTNAIDRPVFKQFKNPDKLTFKRPDAPDWMTTSELKKAGFSGIRLNSLSDEWEIWIDGNRKAFGLAQDREAFLKAYADVFALDDVKLAESLYPVAKP